MKKTIVIIVVVVLGLGNNIYAQFGNFRMGTRLYNDLAFADAIPYFEDAVQSDPGNTNAIRYLAECYRQTNNKEKMLLYYEKVSVLPDVKPIEKYYYGQALMQNGKYQEAKPWLEAYTADERGKVQSSGIVNLPAFFRDSANFVVESYSVVNSSSSEFGPAIFGSTLMFSSNRYRLDALSNRHSWTGKDFYSVYLWEGEKSSVVNFNGNVQTKYNDGPVSYDQKNNVLYLTRNQAEKKKVIKSADDQIKLRIISFSYNQETKKWSDEKAFPFNNKDYNVAHPAVSPDGAWMVFASDLPGGEGGMDLWICQMVNGAWADPINLGKGINTKGNEIFPFLSNDNILFFSSDGLEGLGGLDIYFTSLKNGKTAKVNSAGYPINSKVDDFNFIVARTGNIAYFASNREGGNGDDDIYHVTIRKPFRTSISVSGTTLDAFSKTTIPGTVVVLKGADGKVIAETTTDDDGFYEFDIEPDLTYTLSGNKSDYSEGTKQFEGVLPEGVSAIVADLEMYKNEFGLYCLIKNKKDNTPLPGVKVVITDRQNKAPLVTFTTTESGDFREKLNDAKLNDLLSYNIEITKDGFLGKTFEFEKKLDKPGYVDLNEYLDVSLDPIAVGTDLAKIIDIRPIYFDVSKWNIRPDAAIELDKIVKVMEENPEMVIELGSHTDCRSSASSNMTLSDKRAKASAAYIVSKGIDKKRIYGKGYGETKLVNDCACEGNKKSDCDEGRHQQNRRTEFIIVKM